MLLPRNICLKQPLAVTALVLCCLYYRAAVAVNYNRNSMKVRPLAGNRSLILHALLESTDQDVGFVIVL